MPSGKINSARDRAASLACVIPLVCVVLCTVVLSPIRIEASPREAGSVPRLLTSLEGRAIVNAVWEYEREARSRPDCSHLVHQIYLLAGLGYPYTSSSDLYAGSENFRRVKTPQGGDLIIWPGHVGIVLDPTQHTFYSSVHSGLETEFYDTPYWQARGRPRFYRYVIEGPGSPALVGSQGQPRARETPVRHVSAPVTEEVSEDVLSSSKPPLKPAPDPTPQAVDTSTAADPVRATEIPSRILIATRQKKPTREEIAEAISELSITTGNALRVHDPLKPRLPVVIIDHFEVERVEIKRDHGWAYVSIDSSVSITGEGVSLKQRHEKARWELRHTQSGWEALTSGQRAYLTHNLAVRILAAQLAQLTQGDGALNREDQTARQEAQLAALLDNLLNNR